MLARREGLDFEVCEHAFRGTGDLICGGDFDSWLEFIVEGSFFQFPFSVFRMSTKEVKTRSKDEYAFVEMGPFVLARATKQDKVGSLSRFDLMSF